MLEKNQKTLLIIAGLFAALLLILLILLPLRNRPAAPGLETPAVTITTLPPYPAPAEVTATPTRPARQTASATAPGAPTATRTPTTTPTSEPQAARPSATAEGPREFYVSVDGREQNDGSQASPWPLQFVLDHPSQLRPGDTVWLREGRYAGSFVSNLKGAEGQPITVRAMPGERVTLTNAGLVLDIANSHYVNFWGLEITASENARNPDNRQAQGMGVRIVQDKSSHHINFINMVVHDMPAQGFGWWQANTNSEIYGSLIYYNGVNQFDHGIYVHNNTGDKRLVDNLIFDNASHGIHAYGEKDYQGLNNLHIEGNTVFNNGSIGYSTSLRSYGIYKRNILVGGDLLVAESPVISNNYTYYPSGSGEALNLGYKVGSNNALVENNYFAGGRVALGGQNVGINMANNTILGFGVNSFSQLGMGMVGNQFLLSKPRDVRIFVRPNQYEAGRANITIYNWQRQNTVSLSAIDLQGVEIQSGDRYELRNAQDFYADVITGTYDGQQIEIPMTGRSVAQPLGLTFKPGSTFPEFGAFVLIVQSGQ